MPMTPNIQIAKFKFCQYQMRAVSPNLMFVKLTHYTTESGSSENVLLICAMARATWCM